MPDLRPNHNHLFGSKCFYSRHPERISKGVTLNDFLFLAALAIQVFLLISRMETVREAMVILLFHVVGTLMELFKASVGSWAYPKVISSDWSCTAFLGLHVFIGRQLSVTYYANSGYAVYTLSQHESYSSFGHSHLPQFLYASLYSRHSYIDSFVACHYSWDLAWSRSNLGSQKYRNFRHYMGLSPSEDGWQLVYFSQ